MKVEEYRALVNKKGRSNRKPQKDWPDEYPGVMPTPEEIEKYKTEAWPKALEIKIHALDHASSAPLHQSGEYTGDKSTERFLGGWDVEGNYHRILYTEQAQS